ncbi:MAG: hypothetical protein ACJ796_06335 [Gemmatimonadaceae bacterium]
MFIELAEVLRCPNSHDESWLVLAADRVDGRDAMEGTLGCPVCKCEFDIKKGIAQFAGPPRTKSELAYDIGEATRLAALLDLTDARGYAILVGEVGTLGETLRDLVEVQLLLINPRADIEMGKGLSGLTIHDDWAVLPLAAATARAVALARATTPPQLEAALTVVKVGGRVVAPIALAVPDGVIELARDDRHWVAERTRAPLSSGIISLERRR